ncbi:MAG: magnesium transporter [Planctomycetota bacterium]
MASSNEDLARDKFRDLLRVSQEQASQLLGDAHPGDAAAWLRDSDEDDAWRVFSLLDAEHQAAILEYADTELTGHLVGRMSTPDLREVVAEMATDEAADLLEEADDQVTEDVLASLDAETAEGLRALLAHDSDTAGGVMATEVVTVSRTCAWGRRQEVKKLGDDAEGELGTFVVDENNRPIGYISDRDILTHNIHETVQDVMVEPFVIPVEADQEEAARLIERYGLQSLAVVDEGGALVGVISAEDASEIRGEEAEEDLARIVGTSTGQQTRLPIWTRVRQRMPLMVLTVAGGMTSAKLLAFFTGGHAAAGPTTGTSFSDILRYLPLIIGLAGNVGVQSSTILIRGYATGEIKKEREMRVLGGELAVGIFVGLLCGIAVSVAASWIEIGHPIAAFGLSVGGATALAVTWAAFLGCVVPAGCRRIGADPAIVAGPFLISVSDVTGSLIYIMIAKTLLLP